MVQQKSILLLGHYTFQFVVHTSLAQFSYPPQQTNQNITSPVIVAQNSAPFHLYMVVNSNGSTTLHSGLSSHNSTSCTFPSGHKHPPSIPANSPALKGMQSIGQLPAPFLAIIFYANLLFIFQNTFPNTLSAPLSSTLGSQFFASRLIEVPPMIKAKIAVSMSIKKFW